MTDQDRWTLEEMERIGGSFCKALAQAAFLADDPNFEKIKRCWPDYFAKYEALANLKERSKKADAHLNFDQCNLGLEVLLKYLADRLPFIDDLRLWRPIATAPKDGTYVIIGGPSYCDETPLLFEICRWEVRRHDNKEGWWSYSNLNWSVRGENPGGATRWMPLPTNGKEFA